MASNRSRSTNSVGNKLNNLDSRVGRNEKGTNNPHLSPDVIEEQHITDASVAEAKLADRAVTENKIARGAVGTEHLGVVNTITADSGLTLKPGPDGGFIVIDGPEYVAPAAGSGELYALGFNELNQVVVSSEGIGGGDGIAAMPAGSIQPWPTRIAPEGWLVCDGSAVSRATYPDLFGVLVPQIGTGTFTNGTGNFIFSVSSNSSLLSVGDSIYFTTTGALPGGLSANTLYFVSSTGSGFVTLNTTRTITTTGYSLSGTVTASGVGTGTHTLWFAPYGNGNGTTTFNVPDIRGRAVVGLDSNQTEFNAVGERGGDKTHILTAAQMPVHSHGNFLTGTTSFASTGHTHGRGNYAAAIGATNNSIITIGYEAGGARPGGQGPSVSTYGISGGNQAGQAFNHYTPVYGDSGGPSATASVGLFNADAGSGQAHNNLQPYIALTYIIKHMVADGMQGPRGIQGEPGNAATVAVGTTTTGSPGSVAAVSNAGTTNAAVLNFTIPRGDTGATGATGPQGPSGTVTVGSTSTGAEGTDAQVTNSGTSTNAVLEFVIPRGDAASIAVGTTTTGEPGSEAEVTNSGDGSNAIFDFTIPAGVGATIEVGTVETVTEDDPATVTNSGTDTDAIFDFEIPQGDTGNPAGVKFSFSTTTTDSDPGNGVVRVNNSTLESITSIFLDNLDANGDDQTTWYQQWDDTTNVHSKGYIFLAEYRTNNVLVLRIIGSVTGASGYYKVPVTYVSGSLPANAANIFVSFAQSGDQGIGFPAGGDTGQILAKDSNADYDYVWIDNYADWTSQVKHRVKAAQSLTIGQAVYVSGSDGTNMLVSKASNATEATSSKTMGLIMESLSVNGQGFVITEGLLSGLNTLGATQGDPVWLGTDGGLIFGLTNKPVAPAHLVFIGIVTRVNQNNGEIFVKVQNGFELRELHDVLITNPTNGQALAYDATSGLWINTTPATTLDSLTDVELTEPILDGQALAYDSSTETWINTTPATTLDSLTDVELTEPVAVGQALTYVLRDSRTNLVSNPNFETNTNNWSTGDGSVSRSTTLKYSGSASLRFNPSDAGRNFEYFRSYTSLQVVSGQSYSASFRLKTTAVGQNVSARLNIRGTESTTEYVVGDGTWQLVKIENAIAGSGSAQISLTVWDDGGNGLNIDEVLIERGPTVGDYFDGATSGATWAGTPNASLSTLSPQSLWTNETPASTLDSLTDVDISTVAPVDGDVLSYDAVAEEWIAQSAGNASLPAGSVMAWAGATAPAGWLLCNGQAISRTEYGSLFTAIGTTFGAGDTVMTFNVPDLRGRTAFGRDSSQSEFDTLGEVGGSKTTTFPTYGDGTSTGNGLMFSESMSSVDDGTYNNLPPYQTLNYIIKWTSGESATDESQLTDRVTDLEEIVQTAYNQLPAGSIMAWASNTAPSNWLVCDGSAVSRSLYASLYATIGDTYGAGDGTTTFNLPNLKGRVPVGRDGANSAFDLLGETGGDQTHSLDGTGTATGYGLLYGSSMDTADTTGTNMPPYQVVNYVIKATAGITEEDSALTNRVSTLEATVGSMFPAGTILASAITTAPDGWAICDGSAVSRSTYASLFAAIGTTYGVGDNVTTFNLPNLKGRTIFGRDAAQTEFDTLGESGGNKLIQGHGSGTATGYGLTYSESVLTATGLTTAQNLPPYTALNYLIRLVTATPDAESEFVTRLGELETFVENGGNESPAGSIMAWGALTAPANWLLCDGSVVLRATWPSLYNAIGTQYNTGGETSLQFRLPNLQGRVAVGRDASQIEFDTLGETGGAKTHTLTASEMPSHTHTFSGTTSTDGAHTHASSSGTSFVTDLGAGTQLPTASGGNYGFRNNGANTASAGAHSHTYSGTTVSAGSGSAHNNLQPYIVLNYIIKATSGVSTTDSVIVSRVGVAELDIEAVETRATSLETRATALELANSTTNRSGLVPVIPASISVSSGSGSVSSTGVITFSGVSSLTLNNCFSSTYRIYKIVYNIGGSGAEILSQFRGGGSTVSTAYFGGSFVTQFQGTTGSNGARSNGSNMFIGRTGGETGFGEITVSPNSIEGSVFKPHLTYLAYSRPDGAAYYGGYGSNHSAATDSFIITASTGNFSGTITIYGYR